MITHIKRTMQSVDVLYGVTMQEPGVSRLVSVKVNSAAQLRWKDTGTTAAEIIIRSMLDSFKHPLYLIFCQFYRLAASQQNQSLVKKKLTPVFIFFKLYKPFVNSSSPIVIA